jgi:Protein of unknown function (DUF2971)
MPEHSLDSILERAVAIAPLEMDSFDAQLHYNLWFAFDEEQPLSHYIRLDYFKCLLDASALRFKRLDLYSDTDRYEGRFPTANATQEATVSERLTAVLNIKRDHDAMIASQEIARQYWYIHCWFGQESESRPMWERYGEQGRGVCIRSSTSRMRRSVLSPGSHIHLHPGKVTYSDEATPIGTTFSLAPAFRKHPDYRDESEYRLLAVIPPEHMPTDADGCLAPALEFQPIPVSLSELVAEVLIGPECSVDQIAEVFDLARRYLPGARVNSSRFWRP